MVTAIQAWRAEQHNGVTNIVPYLAGAAAAAVNEIGDPRSPNSPHFVPNAASCDDLKALRFIDEECLVAVLCDRWNQVEAVFERNETFYLVSWFTTA